MAEGSRGAPLQGIGGGTPKVFGFKEELMRVTKKGAVCAVLAAAAVFLFAGLCVPKRTHVEKVLPCTEEGQAEPVTTEIRGTYYAYLLRDDVFNGVIEIQGKR